MSSRPELVALRSFLSVYRTGGVARAAEALGLSQPAVSRHLKAIEESVGRPLFRRAGRGIAPTEAGHSLAAEVAEHIDALEGALDGLRSATLSGAGPVFVGAPVDLLERFVVPRMPPLLAEGLTVRCRVGLSPDLVNAVLRDEIDVALLTKIEGVPTRRMYLVPLLEERFLLVGPAGEEPYAPGRERRFVGYTEDMPMARRYFRECWAVRPPTPALIVNDFRAVVAAVIAGAGLTVVPHYLVEEHIAAGRLAVLHEPPQPVVNSVHIGTRRGREHLPRIRAVFGALSTVD
ncbi:LysR family transcriptional regulator [Kutzneria buriramensis]|uniref:DNA-binding transcriptional LysR family regulator n=1 Tax=Kutzneria buriramensis TaxID=1045776 RepID=A0A3E0I585_9PSEU|nr:LysR family transcriptional regulator [Kutzneria buriramensis]REH53893.1 DNA-binding transcriptional LysR family regulator [Kutzneria buriramensis]